ncbi:carboxypeptidase M32 [Salisediminibacterium selenitireducens]|uniref:Metal-dependent carboxypeptidase n=1 Tax=Bacillus selenitireducens (strain ATCC 700615 / DSM 15326 / MLS10) TaxID=439292 RepID=D6XUD4_BACIE|nr:carboxypeptidase M32 [Salisediminibacterium selenitireducens]ADH99420.1 Carboxypeptidase Taq [[Bacillus] selenitireducens MLS10]
MTVSVQTETVKEQFSGYVKKMNDFKEASGLMAWDLRTGAPRKGAKQRSEVLGTLSSEVFAMSTSEEMKTMIDTLKEEEHWYKLDDITKKSVLEVEKTYNKIANVPPEEHKAYVILTSNAEVAWEQAKEKANFASFQPYLEKIVDYNRKYAEWVGYEGNKYNALLDDFEPGLTVDVIDSVFGKLKDNLVPLVKQITDSKNDPETGFLFSHFPKENQEAFSKQILGEMQYDFDAGRLDTTVHPFCIGLNPGDVRVTTKYDESDFRTAVFGTIHEGGHALYEQNISESLVGTPLAGGTSMGIHESQSLFWENFVGRHIGFWTRYYQDLKSVAGGSFDSVDLHSFFRAINVAGPSLIRIEADELTYCLHIIARYELEKALINEELEVRDLPEAWNNKMDELLGVRPSHDGEGVLQDVHWAGGMFGYFPSYALGYVYAAQLKAAMLNDLSNFDELLEQGNLKPVKEWMTEHVHQHGKMKEPLEILKDVTGSGVDPDYLIGYLSDKYKTIYELKD